MQTDTATQKKVSSSSDSLGGVNLLKQHPFSRDEEKSSKPTSSVKGHNFGEFSMMNLGTPIQQKSKTTDADNKKTTHIEGAVDEESLLTEQLSFSTEGFSLPSSVREKFERAFQTDFGDVRIHEGSEATSIGALAYTQGNDIHFAPGNYNPDSQSGQELLGHELTHVTQQRMGRVSAASGKSINTDSTLEAEADNLGMKAARGESVQTESGSGYSHNSIQCQTVQRWEWGRQPDTERSRDITGPYLYGNVNDADGIDFGGSLLGHIHDQSLGVNALDYLYGRGNLGAWNTDRPGGGQDTRYGIQGNAGAFKGDFNIGQWLGLPDDNILTADVGAFTAGAEASGGTDGFSLGAQANFAEASVTGGTSSQESDTDEIGRFGLSAGGGAAVRGHWGDMDNDGNREYGFGFDFGPVSADIKTEDPLRTAIKGMASSSTFGLLPPFLVESWLPEENLTHSAGESLSDAWDWTKDTASNAWDSASDTASDTWDWTKGAASDVADTASSAWDWTKDTASNAWDSASDTASDAWDWTKGAASDVANTASSTWDWTKDTASDAWDSASDTASDAWDSVSGAASGAREWLEDLW